MEAESRLAAVTSPAGGGALPGDSAEGDHGCAVGSSQASGPCVLGAVPGRVRGHRDNLPVHHQRLIDAPVKPVFGESSGARDFQRPVHTFSGIVWGIQIQPAVRVFELNFCQLAHQRER